MRSAKRNDAQKIRDPEGIEEVASTSLFLAVVLSEINEVEYIVVPGFQVNCEGARTLVAPLVDVACSRIICTEHGYYAVRVAIGACNVGSARKWVRFDQRTEYEIRIPRSPDTMDVQANATSSLADHGTGFQSIVDTFDRVILHANKKTRTELWVGSASIEKCGRRMREIPFRH